MPKLTITTNEGEILEQIKLDEDEYPDLDKPLVAADIMEAIRRAAMVGRIKELDNELQDAWIGEGNATASRKPGKGISFLDWVSRMADNDRGTLQDAARLYTRLRLKKMFGVDNLK